MTDKPEKVAAEVTETEQRDPTLGPRRLLVVVLSFALGGVLTAVSMAVFPGLFGKPPIPLDALLPISFVEVPLLPLAALPFGLLVMIWLDYFMGTKIVVD